ncbi:MULTISPECIES: GNAT family N-acetyltransferase [unclassified Oceanispirochaeta]|uniref:GNAT family N-acetyltransferase n=1 Tax=unclassified Oceanispirochaeta TaxID=2635722 RepID=UPI001313EF75|nr:MULTISPECIES: GNAT family protein [unclassified Oceanispirochaeta]MBF9017982.1 GNAT family N-acetyltransferase [Oceanispirochaeta sp. M2]NPD74493.1 GNAT family N-acetyltransferase [Oceanispirochaeta sp. M1]
MSESKIGFEYLNYKLRKPQNKDAAKLISISNDNETMEFYGSSGSYIKTEEEALKEISWMTESFSDNAGRWIIVEKESDEYIGDIGFFNYSKTHKRIEIGYKLEKSYWGKGIITNFIGLLLKYAFDSFDNNRIEALVDERNIGSKIVLQKNKFQYEGKLREYEFENNNFVNLEMYSLLRADIETPK